MFSAVCLLIVVHGSKCVWHAHRYTTKCGYQTAGCPTTSSLCLVGRSVAVGCTCSLTWKKFLDNSHLSFIHLLCTCILYTYCVCMYTEKMNSMLLGFQHLWTQREGMTMDRHWRRQMPMRSSQPKVGGFFFAWNWANQVSLCKGRSTKFSCSRSLDWSVKVR